ncbi:MAG: peroxiredoxin [Bdellovibrionaceae bacterium]|nr:peroxiredoxin [Pseudobdellovibrionaceae bacterium]
MKTIKIISTSLFILLLTFSVFAAELKASDKAPLFKAKLQSGKDFNLENQKGKWTVLYFFPKSDTPGCTTQAYAFGENIKKITSLGTDVYGISMETVEEQAAFHKKHGLKISLISDKAGTITQAYGAKMPMMEMAKRWTFILDDQLVIRKVDHEVDPVTDAEKVATFIANAQKSNNKIKR